MIELAQFLGEKIEEQEQMGWQKKKREKIAVNEIEKFMKKIKEYLSECIQKKLIDFKEVMSKTGKWEDYEISSYSIRFLDKEIYVVPMPQQKRGEKQYDGGINLGQSFFMVEILDDETARWNYEGQLQVTDQNFAELMDRIFVEKLSEEE